MAIIIAKIVDPIGFIVSLIIVLLSRKWWIIIVAAVASALIVETVLSELQYGRLWGEALPYGLVASSAQASIVFFLREIISRRKGSASNNIVSDETERDLEDPSNPISNVERYLNEMGYDLTDYGAAVALLELESGYGTIETASHISLTTLALDVREAGSDVSKVAYLASHAMSVLDVLKKYKDSGQMDAAQWRNDSMAIFHVVNVDENQKEWIEKILSDPVAGKERLATSRY